MHMNAFHKHDPLQVRYSTNSKASPPCMNPTGFSGRTFDVALAVDRKRSVLIVSSLPSRKTPLPLAEGRVATATRHNFYLDGAGLKPSHRLSTTFRV